MELQLSSRHGGPSPPPRYSTTEDRAEEAELDTSYAVDDWTITNDPDTLENRRPGSQADLPLRLCIFVGISWTIGLYSAYPAPTTVPLFIGSALILAAWVILTWVRIVKSLAEGKDSMMSIRTRYSVRFRVYLALATALFLYWLAITLFVGAESDPPVIDGKSEKYFIAVNLHNNEAILHDFIKEMVLLIFHLGRHNIFLSIYESNSSDGTQNFLNGFRSSLSDLDVRYRILSVDNDPGSQWPYGTSPERIQFLARARNMAIEPLQSPNNSIRLPDWQSFTKVIFLNDILFRWQDIVSLIATRIKGEEDQEYDLACSMDFGSSGLYDTWVARDLRGTPLRAFWPFAKDQVSQQAIRDETPFEVATCWNGAVVFDAKPVLYSSSTVMAPISLSARGWKAVDDPSTPGSRSSPSLTDPIKFRASGVDACDHSECFLFSYDLHRLYNGTVGRPKILMNPAVRVAYEKTWYRWNNTVLRRPIIRWWLNLWSHGIGYKLFDWPFEHFGRRRDYCTWAGLKVPTENGRCPPLPRARNRPWNE